MNGTEGSSVDAGDKTDMFETSTSFPSVPTATATNIIPNVFQGLALALSLYFLCALIWYERNEHRAGRTVGIAQMLVRTRSASISIARRASRRRGKWLRYFCIFGALLCACLCVNDLVYYNITLDSDVLCTLLRNLGVSILSALDATVYCFLWLRQYVVYKRVHLKSRGTGLFIKILQWTVLFFIIALYIVTNALLFCCRRFVLKESSGYCSQTPNPVNDSFSKLWTAGSISLHVILVTLFAFPLLKHSCMKSSKNVTPSPNTGSVFATTKTGMVSLVRRCLIISALCVITDLLVMAITETALKAGHYSQLRHVLYNYNVIWNVTSATASLKEWRAMLFLCDCKSSAQEDMDISRRNTAFETSSTNNNHQCSPARRDGER